MTQEKKHMTLAGYLIEKTNTDAYRSGKLTGWKHPKVGSELIQAVGGRTALIEQARKLEGVIQCNWDPWRTDIESIDYDVEQVAVLCEMEGIPDPRARQQAAIDKAKVLRETADRESLWISGYYREMEDQLEKGHTKYLRVIEDDRFLSCLDALLHQNEPVWKRIFSGNVFGNAKVFEREYQDRIVEILKKSPLYEDEMSADELLEVHGILSYAQTLEWKGSLQFQIGQSGMIDTAPLIYGTVINAQTLVHARPVGLSGVRKIMTIENKANYEAMQFDAQTLYIYCHGFFSPKEMSFLKSIKTLISEDVECYHRGDLDFGGIRIYRFIKEHLFPKLQPYQMGRTDYERVLSCGGIPLTDEKREKLQQMDLSKVPEMEELRTCILEYQMEIEQELQFGLF